LIKPQSVWNVRLGRHTGSLYLDVLQCRSIYSNGPETAPKYTFCDTTIKQFSGGEHWLGVGAIVPIIAPMDPPLIKDITVIIRWKV